MRTPIVSLDRATFASCADLAEMIRRHLDAGEIVQVVDLNGPTGKRLRYSIQWDDHAGHVTDASGRRLGVFADLAALVEHAETFTA